MSAFIRFTEVFETITNEIPFAPEYNNGTGYFNYLVKNHLLEAGKLARCTDPHGRRIILVGTPFGNLVVFDRYQPKFDGTDVIVINQSRIMNSGCWLHERAQRIEDLHVMFGDHYNNANEYNIGACIQHFMRNVRDLNVAA